jgi:hypothetical protein
MTWLRTPLIFLSSLAVIGCSSGIDQKSIAAWQQICGRDEGTPQERTPIYRVKVDTTWRRVDPEGGSSIADTRLPNCTFLISEGGEEVRITVHTFPSDGLEERIPPQAQVARWKGQFKKIEPGSLIVAQRAYGGFAGLYFEAAGTLNGQEEQVMAWSMQLDMRHFQALSAKQERADYTIKVVGPYELVNQHRDQIERFAHSFELIHPIPSLQ